MASSLPEEVSGQWKLHFKNIEWESEEVAAQYMVLGKLRSLSLYIFLCILLFCDKDKGDKGNGTTWN